MDKMRIKALYTDQLDKVVGGSNNDDGEGDRFTTMEDFCQSCHKLTIFKAYDGGRIKCTECENWYFDF